MPIKDKTFSILTDRLDRAFFFVCIISLPLAAILFINFHFKLINFPYQLEYREGAALLTTNLLLNGINPFAVSSQPQYLNVYGIFYHIIMLPVSQCFGLSLPAHRVVSAIFIWASCALLFFIMAGKRNPKVFPAAGTLVFYASTLYPMTSTPLAGPHALGLFLFLSSLSVPIIFNFSLFSMFLSIVLGILGFYTKAYFVLGIPYLAAYLFFFVSKKRGIGFLLAAIILFLILIFPASAAFPTYFNNCFFLHCNVVDNSLVFLLMQLKVFLSLYGAMILIPILAAGFTCAQRSLADQGGSHNFKLSRFNIFSWNRPFVEVKFDFWLFCFICSVLVICFLLGKHQGSRMAYLFQLLTPFLMIVLVQKIRQCRELRYIAFISIVITLSHFFWATMFDLNAGKKEWENTQALMANHKNVFNSPAIVSVLVGQNMAVYDSGLSEYSLAGAESWDILLWKFKPDMRIVRRNFEYRNAIIESVEKKKFDLVILTRERLCWVPKNLADHYAYAGDIHILMPFSRQKWSLMVLRPK